MRRALLGAVLFLGALAAGPGGAYAGDESPPDAVARVAKALSDVDPLAEGSTSELLTAQKATYGEPLLPLRAIGADAALPDVVRDRALRLRVALTHLTWLQSQPGQLWPSKATMWWLALDELDRELPKGPRETLLARAFDDAADREAALKVLAAGRDVAMRFCRDWNEIEHDDVETKKYAALRDELVKAGRAAIPYLATLLAVPPQAVFANLDEAKGPTARQQVRALFALSFLEATDCIPQFVFHVRGPSFTSCATARGALKRLAKLEWPDDADEAAQIAAIDAWWAKFIRPRSEDDPPDAERNHLVRHTLRWARNALASGKPEVVEGAAWGPRQLAHVVGKLSFDADAPAEKRAAQLAALEREAMRATPTYVCTR